MNLRRLLSLFCSSAMALQLLAADNKSAISVEEIQNLRQKIAEQQKQIEQLQKSVAEQQALLDTTLKTMAPPSGSAAVATSKTRGTAPAANAGRLGEKTSNSPLSFKIGGVDFSPLGFVDFTYVGRSTNVGSGIGTNFAGIPYGSGALDGSPRTHSAHKTAASGSEWTAPSKARKCWDTWKPIFWGISPATCS